MGELISHPPDGLARAGRHRGGGPHPLPPSRRRRPACAAFLAARDPPGAEAERRGTGSRSAIRARIAAGRDIGRGCRLIHASSARSRSSGRRAPRPSHLGPWWQLPRNFRPSGVLERRDGDCWRSPCRRGVVALADHGAASCCRVPASISISDNGSALGFVTVKVARNASTSAKAKLVPHFGCSAPCRSMRQ